MSRICGLIIGGVICYWIATIVGLHVFDQQFNPVKAPMSAFAKGSYSTWMFTTFLALSVIFLVTAIGLGKYGTAATANKVAVTLFGISAGGTLIAGAFPMDYPGPPTTISGRLHQLGGVLTFIPGLIGMLSFSLSARRENWRWLKKPLIVLSIASFAAFGLVLLSNSILGHMGFAQRILMTGLLSWFGVISIGLIKNGSPRKSPPRVVG